MKKIILTIGLIAFFVTTIILIVRPKKVSATIPDNQCYRIATNKDKVLKNMGGALQWTGSRKNPCTGRLDIVNTYYDLDGGIAQIRNVYDNGDTEGYLGLTRYFVCQDGRAKVTQRIYGAGRGYGVGFWTNFPFDDDSVHMGKRQRNLQHFLNKN